MPYQIEHVSDAVDETVRTSLPIKIEGFRDDDELAIASPLLGMDGGNLGDAVGALLLDAFEAVIQASRGHAAPMAGLITLGSRIASSFVTPNADRNREVDIEEGPYTVLSPGQQKRVKIAQST